MVNNIYSYRPLKSCIVFCEIRIFIVNLKIYGFILLDGGL